MVPKIKESKLEKQKRASKVIQLANSIPIDTLMQDAYLMYALSTMTRGIPFTTDGLKPIQRRILYVLWSHQNRLVKSARIVGDTIGMYSPHGDQAAYNAMVRMAQDFKLNHPLVLGQGNWGNADGDGAASMRYTECKISPFALDVYFGDEFMSCDFTDNYDNTLMEPLTLSPKIPMIPINGCSGMVSGYATDIPTHNLKEVCDMTISYLKSEKNIERHIKGPDFNAGCWVYNTPKLTKGIKGESASIMLYPSYVIEKYNATKLVIRLKELPWGRSKDSMMDHYRSKQTTHDIFRRVHDIVDLSGGGVTDLQIITKSNVTVAEAEELMHFLLSRGIFSNVISYTPRAISFDIKSKVMIPKTLSFKQMIDEWYGYRALVLKRHFTKVISDIELKLKRNEYMMKFIANYEHLSVVILKSNEEKIIKEFRKFKIDEEGVSYILSKNFRSVRNRGEEVHNEHYDLTKQLEAAKAKLNNIHGEILANVMYIRDKYSVPRKTKIVPYIEALAIKRVNPFEGASKLRLTEKKVTRRLPVRDKAVNTISKSRAVIRKKK